MPPFPALLTRSSRGEIRMVLAANPREKVIGSSLAVDDQDVPIPGIRHGIGINMLTVALLWALAAPVSAQGIKKLFLPPSSQDASPMGLQVESLGRRPLGLVRIDRSALPGAFDLGPTSILLNVASIEGVRLMEDGRDLVVTVKREAIPPALGHAAWSGIVQGEPNSTVTFSEVNNIIAGTVRRQGEVLKIRRRQGEMYSVERTGLQRYPDEAEPLTPPSVSKPQAAEDANEDAAKKCRDDAQEKVVNVYVFYSDRAEQSAGGSGELQAITADIFGESNLALRNSGVPLRLVLIGLSKLSIEPHPVSGTYLQNFASNTDVQRIREQYKADIVSLLDEMPKTYDYCGVGYLMNTANNPTKSTGYNIAGFTCAWDNFSLLHEIGHNLGAGHGNTAKDGLFAYSRGAKWPGQFRTVMAYRCSDKPCDRIPRFTNPKIVYSGVTLGNPETVDNARTLIETRCSAANWYN